MGEKWEYNHRRELGERVDMTKACCIKFSKNIIIKRIKLETTPLKSRPAEDWSALG